MNRRYPKMRLEFLAGFALFLLLAVGARLAQIQLIQGESWKRHAQQQTQQEKKVLPRRGMIADRHGQPLAHTELSWDVSATRPRELRAREDAMPALARLLGKSQKSIQRQLRGADGFTRLGRGLLLSPDRVDSLRRFPELAVDAALRRHYDVGDVAARLLGGVEGAEGELKSGLELMLDQQLSGEAGLELVRYDGGLHSDAVIRTPLREPRAGEDINLTIDLGVQMILEEELERACAQAEARSGVGILIDPWTGEVIAMAAVSGRARKGRSSWAHPAVVDIFEPGSTFKFFTLAALLANAVADGNDRFDGEGKPNARSASADFGGFKLHDIHPVGEVSLRHAYAVSSNIIFGKAVRRLQPDEFHGFLRRVGMGERSGSGWPAESRGLFKTPADWSGRSQSTIAIGQEISVNLLQLVSGFAALVTDGELRAPRFVHSSRDADGQVVQTSIATRRKGIVPPGIIPLLRQHCRDVVSFEEGTGALAEVPGLKVAGKTGTGEIWNETAYLTEEFTASFVGFAPFDRPRLLGAIVLNNAKGEGRFGGKSAAPAFARVLSKVAATTRWLDPPADEASRAEVSHLRPAPTLIGRSREHVLALIEREALRMSSPLPGEGARVIGQLPPPGSPMDPATPLQLAWARP